MATKRPPHEEPPLDMDNLLADIYEHLDESSEIEGTITITRYVSGTITITRYVSGALNIDAAELCDEALALDILVDAWVAMFTMLFGIEPLVLWPEDEECDEDDEEEIDEDE